MILKGNILHAPELGTVEVHAGGWLVTQGERVVGIYDTLPREYQDQPVIDWGDSLIIPAFHDLHIHAPQIVNRGIGYDEQLLPWLERYTFPTESMFSNLGFAEQVWKAFLNRLWESGTMGFAAFATVHKQAAWRLMELTEASGLRGLVGKVNMDRNSPQGLREDTQTSLAETEELICRSREELKRTGFNAPVCPLHHGKTDGRTGTAGRALSAAGAVPPVGKSGRDRVGGKASPGHSHLHPGI